MKIRSVGVELFMETDGQTSGHDEANSSFSKFFERAQKCEASMFSNLENTRKPQKLIRAMRAARFSLITFNDRHGLFTVHLVLKDSFAALLI